MQYKLPYTMRAPCEDTEDKWLAEAPTLPVATPGATPRRKPSPISAAWPPTSSLPTASMETRSRTAWLTPGNWWFPCDLP